MTNSKSTKRALVSSILAILVCVAMLIGTTFAWFTDTASTGVNTIQAGTLKVGLEKWDVGLEKWVDVEGQTLDFVKATGHENEEILWEPSCTYTLPQLRIVNNGNLALKYKVVITGIQGDAKLNEAIDWTIGDVAQGTEQHLAAGANNEFTISGHMDEAAGNEYQGLSINGIAITVYATQDTVEYDSNSNRYDEDAALPSVWDGRTETAPTQDSDGVYHINTAAEFVSFITNIKSGSNATYTNQSVLLNSDIDLGGYTIVTTVEQGNRTADGLKFDAQGHTVSNFTLDSTANTTGLYGGLFGYFAGWNDSYIKNLTVRNATIIGGKQTGVIVGGINNTNSLVENCNVYDCTIVGKKKVGAVVGYTANGIVKDCYAENCNVYCAENDANECGEVIGFINIVDSGCTDHTKNNTFNNVNVQYGVTVTAVSNATELTNAIATNTANVNVLLNNDITFTSDWTPIDIGFYGDYTTVNNLTINGNGHTISGLNSALVEKISANCSLSISNLTVKGAAINNSSYTNGMGNGILVGYVENGNVTLNNCHVADSSITESSVAAAALIGYISNGTAINITNCTVKNTVVNGDSAAGFVGYTQQSNITVSGCKVSGGSFNGENAQKQGAYFGTVNVGTVANVSNTTADTTALVGRILSTGAVNYN